MVLSKTRADRPRKAIVSTYVSIQVRYSRYHRYDEESLGSRARSVYLSIELTRSTDSSAKQHRGTVTPKSSCNVRGRKPGSSQAPPRHDRFRYCAPKALTGGPRPSRSTRSHATCECARHANVASAPMQPLPHRQDERPGRVDRAQRRPVRMDHKPCDDARYIQR
jgi:hypothetical protein